MQPLLERKIISILRNSASDQFRIQRELGKFPSFEVARAIAQLLEKKKIHIIKYKTSDRFGIDVPVYSLDPPQSNQLDLHSILGGVTSERAVEYNFVSRNLIVRKRRSRILDVGAGDSRLDKSLKEFGGSKWDVIGIDVELGSDVMMDARQLGFKTGTFDQVICISTIEHIGLGRVAGEDDILGDKRTIQEIQRVLKSDGLLILTVPYRAISGSSTRTHVATLETMRTRIYDRRTLSRLIKGFSISVQEFYRYDGFRWQKCSQARADKGIEKDDSGKFRVPVKFHSTACACLLLKRKNKQLARVQRTPRIAHN